MRINIETGKMTHLSAIDEEITEWYKASCDQIEFEQLPTKKLNKNFNDYLIGQQFCNSTATVKFKIQIIFNSAKIISVDFIE